MWLCYCKRYVKLQTFFHIVLMTIFFSQIILVTIIQSYQKADAQMLPRMLPTFLLMRLLNLHQLTDT